MGKDAGFTLSEILTALLIVGILSALSVPTYQYVLNQQKLKVIQAALIELQNKQQIDRLSIRSNENDTDLQIWASGYQIKAELTQKHNYKFVATNDEGVAGCEQLSIDEQFNKLPEACWD